MTSQASSSVTTEQNIPHFLAKIKGFPLKAKSFRNAATYQKLWGGRGSINYHNPRTVRVCICVYVRGLSITDKTKIANIPFSNPLLILPIISFLFVFSSFHFDYIYFSFICLLLFVLLSLVVNLRSTVVRLV